MTPPGTAPEETVGTGEEQDRLRGRGPGMLEEGGGHPHEEGDTSGQWS